MTQLEVMEFKNLRVLTTHQLAESFATSDKTINRNFQRNQEHYIEGLHYFALTGEVLKQFKASRQNDVSLKFVSTLYLWTEKGAWLHAKSLNNDKAWQAYNMLVDSYYALVNEAKNTINPLSITTQQWKQLESKVEILEKALQEVTLHSGEQIRVRKAVGDRVAQLARNTPGARRALFRSLYSSIKERYQVGSYRDVRQHELQDCLRYIHSWKGGKKANG
ncbi:ORF6N domain-containing protein [Rummeliibacillus stabekisii]|uniref:Antirepressor n=1 Tax=Rummeliibacillus stabekisii TaxID=241244 RepID=A0A143HC78_9BACL|nr:ORF6N domain-containing protein [Rummeliibacillus stabekisii]AMW99334.1 hypothetical protein ATY39_07565 [Rummeliibacillus stabekisii]